MWWGGLVWIIVFSLTSVVKKEDCEIITSASKLSKIPQEALFLFSGKSFSVNCARLWWKYSPILECREVQCIYMLDGGGGPKEKKPFPLLCGLHSFHTLHSEAHGRERGWVEKYWTLEWVLSIGQGQGRCGLHHNSHIPGIYLGPLSYRILTIQPISWVDLPNLLPRTWFISVFLQLVCCKGLWFGEHDMELSLQRFQVTVFRQKLH